MNTPSRFSKVGGISLANSVLEKNETEKTMKKLLALLALVLGVVSCQTEPEGLDVNVGGEIDAIVNVTIPEVETRAGGNNSAVGAFGNIDLTKYDVRYILEVYDHNGELAKERLVNTEDEGTSSAFDLRLIPGRAYRFVVWADFVLEDTQVDLHYNTSNLREIAVNTTEWTLSDESRDAYTGVEIVGNFSNSAPIAIELKRPLGKLRVVTTDVKDMYTLLPEDVKVVYTSKIYTSFNAYESDVVATSEVNDAKTIKISNSKYANEWNEEGNVKAGLTLFSDYFFAANDAEAINFTLDVIDNSDLPIPQVVFNTTIPVQRNYLTTVTGPILTDSGNITVTIEDAFEGEIEETYPPASIDTYRVIRYTATEKVVPYKADAFGANIVSNTYEDGQGVITFDASVTSIGDLAFTSCSSLTSITIPESVDSIGGAAFAYCRSLTSITIPDSVTSIGKQAFAYTSLTSVTIPDSVTSIGSSAFDGCTSLTSITIPDSVTSIGDFAFDSCHSLTSVTIPDSVISIGEYAFFGCTSLTSITIGNGVTSIGEAAFYECTKLTSVAIPNSVTSIGSYAFYGCTSLASVTIPDSVISIGDYAFWRCTSLTSITIPDSVTSIGEFAFYECTLLTSVYCKATTPPTGGSYMFSYYSNGYEPIGCRIYVPRESVEAYKAKQYWSDYADYIFEEAELASANNKIWYTSSDGSIITPYSYVFGANIVSNTYENGQGVITFDAPVTSIGGSAFYDCTSLTSITIPDSVTSIGKYAFFGCTSLTSVTIGNGVTSIGEAAFYECTKLTSITIPDSVTSIGDNAFQSCTSLTSVTISNGVTSIGNQAFAYCTSLTSVTIPDSVTSIEYGAFAYTSLTSVTIPDRVTSIGEFAFYECTSLTSVYCKATTPPTGSSNMFDMNASGRKIYVPRNSVEAYQSAEYWSEYASYIEGYDF